VHGGPTDQWQVEFRARVAFWLERGWSVLAPNHRGSTGHGRAYTQAMRGRWGELDVADVAAGARVANALGWGTRMVAMGASAGGFTVLNALSRHPGLFAGGVALYPVVDLRGFAEKTHRFEAHYDLSLVGPRHTDVHGRRSPITRVDEIHDPLLLLHGTDDEVVPIGQSEAMFAALTALGRTVEFHAYEGEGHGWGRPDVVVDELERTAAFLGRHT
jgi:dipeptidyl aminopeptidase/acylaminoacyl peptidase